jgi:hypothetical protein
MQLNSLILTVPNSCGTQQQNYSLFVNNMKFLGQIILHLQNSKSK